MIAERSLRLAALALVLASCGQRPPASNASAGASAPIAQETTHAVSAPRACDVLTEAIAKKYLGDAAEKRRDAQPNPKETQCQWGSDHGVITIMVGPWSMVHTDWPGQKAAEGIGDQAYTSPMGLDVRKGDLGVSINIITQSGEFWGKAADNIEAQQLAAEEEVAPDLLAKL